MQIAAIIFLVLWALVGAYIYRQEMWWCRGEALGIESVGTWPKGYKMRFEDGKDVDKTEEWVHNYIITQVAELEI